jgi:hypothetical protein
VKNDRTTAQAIVSALITRRLGLLGKGHFRPEGSGCIALEMGDSSETGPFSAELTIATPPALRGSSAPIPELPLLVAQRVVDGRRVSFAGAAFHANRYRPVIGQRASRIVTIAAATVPSGYERYRGSRHVDRKAVCSKNRRMRSKPAFWESVAPY